MNELLILLNGFILACVAFGYLRGVKVYRRFFIVLDRKTDAVEHALKELREAKQRIEDKEEEYRKLRQEFSDFKQKHQVSKLR